MNLEDKIITRIEEMAFDIESLTSQSQKLLSSITNPAKPPTRGERISGGLSFLKLESLNQSFLELSNFVDVSKLSQKANKILDSIKEAQSKLKDFSNSKDLPKDLQDFLNK